MSPAAPLAPFAAYGVIEEVDGRLVCHICGRLYRLVALHAWKAHGITGFDYREEFGLARGTSLACPATAQRLRELALAGQGAGRRFDSSSEHSHSGPVGPRRAQVERVHQAARRRMQADGIFQAAGRRGRRRYEEKRWQQLVPRYLAVRAQVATTTDPASRRFRGALRKTLADAGLPMSRRTVLRWERSLGYLFIPSHAPWFTDPELVAWLAALGAKMGRTPTGSDLRHMGLPTLTTYKRRFGSYRDACRRAGLAAPRPVGGV